MRGINTGPPETLNSKSDSPACCHAHIQLYANVYVYVYIYIYIYIYRYRYRYIEVSMCLYTRIYVCLYTIDTVASHFTCRAAGLLEPALATPGDAEPSPNCTKRRRLWKQRMSIDDLTVQASRTGFCEISVRA